MKIHEDIERVLISEEDLKIKIKEMAEKISEAYKGEELVVVTVLKGGVMFSVDLMREIEVPVMIDFMSASSYGASSKSSGVVKIEKDLDMPIEGKNVLLVEDIIDSGRTLSYIADILRKRGPKSLEICTILDKPSRRVVDIDVKYIGFEIPDEFVVGYGLDYAQKHRNLPYVGILKRSVYENE
mgnify:CR=1 FL=1